MRVLDPQQLLDHVARAAAAAPRVNVHRLDDRAIESRGGLTGEVVSILSAAPRRAFTLGEVIQSVRYTAHANDVNSILQKLVHRKKATKGKKSNGRRQVNSYQWAKGQEA